MMLLLSLSSAWLGAVCIHNLGPGRYEVVNKLVGAVGAGINLRHCSQL
jgi:hypothetical protein